MTLTMPSHQGRIAAGPSDREKAASGGNAALKSTASEPNDSTAATGREGKEAWLEERSALCTHHVPSFAHVMPFPARRKRRDAS